MNLRRPLIFAILAACWAAAAWSQELTAVAHPEEAGFSAERLGKLTAAYKGYVDRGELPGAVLLIARGGKVAYFEAVGFQDREKKILMEKDAIFRFASMTKPIVSAAAMTLVEEGKLDLLAAVSKYLPELADLKVAVETTDPASGKPSETLEPQHRPMIVADLMRHTAGFVYGAFGDTPVHHAYRDAKIGDRGDTLAEFITKLSKVPLAHQPGEVWEYSTSVDVLGRVIEVVSGEPLDQFIAERITGPLHMDATDFYVHEDNLARLAEPQNGADGKRPALPDVRMKPNFLSGGGGLTGSTGDYLKFAEMVLNRGSLGSTRILAPSTVTLMTSDALPPGIAYAVPMKYRFADLAPTPDMGQGFGLGFAVRTAAGHNPVPGSVGSVYWTGAWGTTFYVDPQEKLIALQMIQVPLAEGAPYRRAFRNLTYQALIGS